MEKVLVPPIPTRNRSMADSKYIVEEPDLVEAKSVDGSGRIYLGQDYAGSDVRIVVEIIDEEGGDE